MLTLFIGTGFAVGKGAEAFSGKNTTKITNSSVPSIMKSTSNKVTYKLGLKSTESTLPVNFKKNVKLPKNLPFKATQTSSLYEKLDNKVNSFEAVYGNENNGSLRITVYQKSIDVVLPKHPKIPVTVKKLALVGDSNVIYIDNNYAQQLVWHDPETGYLYLFQIVNNQNDRSQKTSVKEFEKLIKGLSKIGS